MPLLALLTEYGHARVGGQQPCRDVAISDKVSVRDDLVRGLLVDDQSGVTQRHDELTSLGKDLGQEGSELLAGAAVGKVHGLDSARFVAGVTRVQITC